MSQDSMGLDPLPSSSSRGTGPAAESPSLGSRGDGGGPAFEVKFLIDEALALEVTRWSERHLARDVHAQDALSGAYETTSLYTDTMELDVYRRSSRYKRRKFRVRRYGHEPWVFLERKNKSGDRVSKRRDRVPLEDLDRLVPPFSVADWAGGWFHQRVTARRLQPSCLIHYERTAYFGASSEGPLRLTLDRRVHGQLWSQWSFATFTESRDLIGDQVILELKFKLALPTPFKQLVADLRLQPSPVSKYRRCREAFGVPTQPAWGAASIERLG